MSREASPETLRKLFLEMLRIRRVEERIADLYPRQEMRCPIHLSIGQEATPVGVSTALAPEDYVLSSHRSHAHYLARGGSLKAMLAELYGKATGCARGNGGSMHLVDLSVGFLGATAIVASTIPIAVGAALGSVMRGERRVTVAYLGEGATEEGVFHESINFASLRRLPVVFVCENNLYSVYSPMSARQPAVREVFEQARGHGVEAYQGDGNDLEEVLSLARRAVEKARGGGGPTFLELATYRWREHCGPAYDNHLGYRAEAEFESWKERCPLARLEARLLTEGHCGREELARAAASIEEEIDQAVRFAEESPFPERETLVDHVYAP
jgi:TPP-dependent pyruvate/acetoin dehydrogenase alpha subunit